MARVGRFSQGNFGRAVARKPEIFYLRYLCIHKYSRILLRDANSIFQWPMLHHRVRESQICEGVIAETL